MAAWIIAGLLSTASAQELHTGIPVRGVEGLGEPDFLTPELGWSAPIEGGFVKVFVGTSAEQASDWVKQAQMSITVVLPLIDVLGDEAWGDASGLLIVRSGNIALQVRAQGNAGEIAQAMLDAIPAGSQPWPSPPVLLEVGEGQWRVEAPGAAAVRFTGGGQASPGADLTFSERPDAVVAWDEWGRPSVWSQ